jgi:hypothetical protein
MFASYCYVCCKSALLGGKTFGSPKGVSGYFVVCIVREPTPLHTAITRSIKLSIGLCLLTAACLQLHLQGAWAA